MDLVKEAIRGAIDKHIARNGTRFPYGAELIDAIAEAIAALQPGGERDRQRVALWLFEREDNDFTWDDLTEDDREVYLTAADDHIKFFGTPAPVAVTVTDEVIAKAWQAVDSDRISEIDVEKILRAGLSAALAGEVG